MLALPLVSFIFMSLQSGMIQCTCTCKTDIFSFLSRYHSDLDATIPTIYQTLDDILSRCGIIDKVEDETNQPQKLSDMKNGPKASLSIQQLEDIVLYLSDTTETLLAFMSTFPPVCSSFYKHDFVQRLACFFELIVPYCRQRLIDIESQKLKEKWKLVKVALIKVCHVVLHTCCIEPLENRYVQIYVYPYAIYIL